MNKTMTAEGETAAKYAHLGDMAELTDDKEHEALFGLRPLTDKALHEWTSPSATPAKVVDTAGSIEAKKHLTVKEVPSASSEMPAGSEKTKSGRVDSFYEDSKKRADWSINELRRQIESNAELTPEFVELLILVAYAQGHKAAMVEPDPRAYYKDNGYEPPKRRTTDNP